MPIEVEMPDGTILEFPEGTSPEAIQRIVNQRMGRSSSQPAQRQDNYDVTPYLEDNPPRQSLGNRARGFAMGVVDPVVGGAQFLANATGIGDETVNNYVNRREQDRWEQRTGDPVLANGQGSFDGYRMTGNVTGGVVASRYIPGLRNPAATRTGRIFQGGAAGAGFGAATPVRTDTPQALEDYWKTKRGQIGVGAAVGSAVPAVIEGGANLRRTFTRGGARDSAEDVIRANTTTTDDLIEGLDETGDVQRAIGRTSNSRLAGLTRQSQRYGGQAVDDATDAARQASQQRLSQLRSVVGLNADDSVDDYITRMEQVREEATEALYQRAAQNPNPVQLDQTPQILRNLADQHPAGTQLGDIVRSYQRMITNSSQVADDVPVHIRDIRDRSQGQNVPRTTTRTVTQMETRPDRLVNVSRQMGIDIGKMENRAISRELSNIKKALDIEVGRTNPAHREATEEWAMRSIDVDRGKIIREMENRLRPTLSVTDDTLMSQGQQQFSSGMNNQRQMVKQATGFKKNRGLAQYFNEDELEIMDGIRQQIGDLAEFNQMAVRGGPAARQSVNEMTRGTQLPSILERGFVIFNSIMSRGGQAAKERTMQEIAKILSDPDELLKVYRSLEPSAQEGFRVALRTYGPAIAGVSSVNQIESGMNNGIRTD